MRGTSRCLTAAALAALALSSGDESRAQTYTPGGPVATQGIRNNWAQGRVPGNGTWANAGAAARYGYDRGFRNGAGYGYTAGAYNPYCGYGYCETPVGGYMQGVASMMQAQGQWMQDFQQASTDREKTKQAMTETRRKQFDEWKYEQARTPTPEDYREQDEWLQLRRARNNPPVTEIYGATPLNTLLTDIQRHPPDTLPGSAVAVNPAMVQQINFAGGPGGASAGLFKDGGRLSWPQLLRSNSFNDERRQIDQQSIEAVRQLQAASASGPPDLSGLSSAVDAMEAKLRGMVADVDANQYMDSMRYIRELRQSVRGLSNPDAANYFNGRWTPQATTISELVREMNARGLRFAPATAGDEDAYVAMYNALLSYDNMLPQVLVANKQIMDGPGGQPPGQ